MGVCAVWAWIVLFNAATDDWAWARPLVVIGVPIAYWLVIQFADQFLAVRGLAALILLIAKVMVDAADQSELPLRLIVTVLAYIWVCVAVWMASAPHQVRDVIGFVTANNTRCRLACFLGMCVGALLVVSGVMRVLTLSMSYTNGDENAANTSGAGRGDWGFHHDAAGDRGAARALAGRAH